MRFTTFALSFLLSGVQSSAIPTDASPIQSSPSTILEARGANTWCGCAYPLEPRNCDQAVQDLKDQMRGTRVLQAGEQITAVRGGVIAFVCNRSNHAVNAVDWEYAERLAEITDQCGLYIAGTWAIENNIGFGYMTWFPGRDPCRNMFD